jgi:hypothetical protein
VPIAVLSLAFAVLWLALTETLAVTPPLPPAGPL